MKIYPLAEIVSHAREQSPFYRALYRDCGPHAGLSELPLLDQASFWNANSLNSNKVLTKVIHDGIVFKSGGTTGNPKFSYYTQEEWESFTEAFGRGIARGGLAPGSRVANLFYAGELYASFLFIMGSLERSGVPLFQLPLAGSTAFEKIAETIHEFKVDVIAGVPTTLMGLAQFLTESRSPLLEMPMKFLFGGESLYSDQRRYLGEHFPNVAVQSIGYASVDAGLLGWADAACKPDEHFAFSDETIMEIVDDSTGQVIRAPGVAGRLVLTSLTRKWMPIIRYPVGDVGEWLEVGKKFKILGRANEGARVGPTTLYFEDIYAAIASCAADGCGEILGLQLVVNHFEMKDELTVRVAVANPNVATIVSAQLLEHLLHQRPMLEQMARENKIHSPRVEFVESGALEKNMRTGKLKRIVDHRSKG